MSKHSTEVVVTKPIIAIALKHNFIASSGCMYVDFDTRTNYRGTDFDVYANTGYTENTNDTGFLANILRTLVNESDTRVSSVTIQPYTIVIMTNSLANADDLMQRIDYAVQRAGFSTKLITSSKR